MGMGVIAIFVPFVILEKPIRHILAARPDRERHQQMRGLPELGLEPSTPPFDKTLGQILDLAALLRTSFRNTL